MLLPLDHNFPQPILETLEPWMGDIQLIPLRAIDHRLPELDDRRLLIALKQLGYGGLVTLNYKMLRNPGVFWLRPRAPKPQDPWDLFKVAAGRRNEDATSLYKALKVSDDEMTTAIL